MPATIPVASTDLVSRNTQKVTANQTVKLMTDTSSVLTSRCTNARSVLLLRSSARVLVVDMRKELPSADPTMLTRLGFQTHRPSRSRTLVSGPSRGDTSPNPPRA